MIRERSLQRYVPSAFPLLADQVMSGLPHREARLIALAIYAKRNAIVGAGDLAAARSLPDLERTLEESGAIEAYERARRVLLN